MSHKSKKIVCIPFSCNASFQQADLPAESSSDEKIRFVTPIYG